MTSLVRCGSMPSPTLKRFVVLLLSLFSPVGAVAEGVDVCFNYSCRQTETVEVSPTMLLPVAIAFSLVNSSAEERNLVGQVIGYLYRLAGRQTPIFRDRGGNFDDDRSQDGAMDCIDHSVTTNEWLLLLERHGWLRFHRVEPPTSRGAILSIHWAARIVDDETGESFVVDPWFFDHGQPAAVMSLDDWHDKKDPTQPEWNKSL